MNDEIKCENCNRVIEIEEGVVMVVCGCGYSQDLRLTLFNLIQDRKRLQAQIKLVEKDILLERRK